MAPQRTRLGTCNSYGSYLTKAEDCKLLIALQPHLLKYRIHCHVIPHENILSCHPSKVDRPNLPLVCQQPIIECQQHGIPLNKHSRMIGISLILQQPLKMASISISHANTVFGQQVALSSRKALVLYAYHPAYHPAISSDVQQSHSGNRPDWTNM